MVVDEEGGTVVREYARGIVSCRGAEGGFTALEWSRFGSMYVCLEAMEAVSQGRLLVEATVCTEMAINLPEQGILGNWRVQRLSQAFHKLCTETAQSTYAISQAHI